MIGPRAQERVTPEATAGCCSFFVSLSVDIGETRVGKHFLEGGGRWVGMRYFDSDPSSPFFFLAQTTKTSNFLPECILQPSMGRLHSQPLGVNNVPNNYVTVFGLPCEKVSPPAPAVLQYANGKKKKKEKGWSLRTRSYGAEPGYCPVAKWMASISFYWWGGGVDVN